MKKEITIRFKDYRTVEGYGKEIYVTNSLEDARRYMRDNDKKMRFLAGGGKIRNNDQTDYAEIYWDVVSR